jgi:hypothetical protein
LVVGGSEDGTGHCHGGGDCGLLGLSEVGDVRHDVVFCYSYGGAGDTRVDVSYEAKL